MFADPYINVGAMIAILLMLYVYRAIWISDWPGDKSTKNNDEA